MIDHIMKRAEERRSRYQTVVWEKPRPPMPNDLQPTLTMGSYSVIEEPTRRRFIIAKNAVQLPDGTIESPTTVARDYLHFYHHGKLIQTSAQWEASKEIGAMPALAFPCTFGRGFYLDIRAAWWEIVNIVGWSVEYLPPGYSEKAFFLRGRVPYDFPFPDHKIARSCLVSVAAQSGGIPKWYCTEASHGSAIHGVCNIGRRVMKGYNYTYRPMLHRLVSDVMNAIAEEALEAGAVYVQADGFIAPNHDTMIKISEVVASWGLFARIKEQGSGNVTGPGCYKVGEKRSRKRVKRLIEHKGIRSLPYREWLKENFVTYSRDRGNWREFCEWKDTKKRGA